MEAEAGLCVRREVDTDKNLRESACGIKNHITYYREYTDGIVACCLCMCSLVCVKPCKGSYHIHVYAVL